MYLHNNGYRRWIIWGAGKIGKKIARYLNDFGERIEYFIDVNEALQGIEINELIVKSEKELYNFDDNCFICVAVSNQARKIIYDIMDKYKIPKSSLFTYMECWKFIIDMHIDELVEKKRYTQVPSRTSIIFGMTNGLEIGGIETWSITMGNLLKKKGYLVKYLVPFGKDNKKYDCIETKVTDVKDFGDKESIESIVQTLLEYGPFVFFADRVSQFLLASYICSKIYPQEIRIVLIIHGGREENIRLHSLYNQWVNSFIGVSKKGICDKLLNYEISEDKIFHVVCPVKTMNCFTKKYSSNNSKIQIGYAARIDFSDEDKRQDYLLELLLKLKKSRMEYHFNIAGDGKSKTELENFIQKNNMEKDITLYGRIEHDKMSDFWQKQDIFINVSDSEGNCMSMLEAMGQGVVPVLTDVSGVRDSIEHEENGFIVKPGDIDGMVHYLNYLCGNRFLLPIMGRKCWKKVKNDYNENRALEGIMKAGEFYER